MAYGSGRQLGETINPQLMNVDFSAYERAGATTGNALANLGQQVGGVIKQYGEDEKTIKKAQQTAKSIADLIPEFSGMANNALNQLNNPDLSQRSRLAIAEGIQDSLKIGVLGLGFKQDARDFDFRERQFASELGLKQRELDLKSKGTARNIMTADELQQQISSGAKVKYIPLGNGMYEVESATANEVPMFGNVMVGPDGQIQQAPTSGGSIRIPGSGGQIQNALPQTQGGSFPSGKNAAEMTDEEIQAMVANTPQLGGVAPNYGNFDQATQGVDIDGNPGVLPPRQQAAQQIQQAQNLVPNAPVPKGDVFTAEGGQVGVTRLPGSTAEIEYKTKEAELKAKEAELNKLKSPEEAGEIAGKRSLNSILGSTSMVLGQVKSALSSNPMLAKMQGAVATIFPASEVGQIEKELENIRVQTSKESIFELKKLTGAIGQTTEKEWPKYESRYGDVRAGMNPEQLQRTLKLNALNTFEAVYGSPDKMNQMLKDGKINQSQFDGYVNSYLETRKALEIPEEGVFGNNVDWSRLDKGILKQSTSRPIGVSQNFMEAYKKFRGK